MSFGGKERVDDVKVGPQIPTMSPTKDLFGIASPGCQTFDFDPDKGHDDNSRLLNVMHARTGSTTQGTRAWHSLSRGLVLSPLRRDVGLGKRGGMSEAARERWNGTRQQSHSSRIGLHNANDKDAAYYGIHDSRDAASEMKIHKL
ncbi:hypothetical protein PV325_013746 [Microctonus aethiopoides]|nr:hypothetical protein PV325_013746 [Microctonus aethiopoides]